MTLGLREARRLIWPGADLLLDTGFQLLLASSAGLLLRFWACTPPVQAGRTVSQL